MEDEQPRVLRMLAPKKSLRELAQEAVRQAILDLKFRPGERLVERTLCTELGVSRTVVREVLRFLEAEGLIENLANRGPVVATIKPAEVDQIYELRSMLEGLAAAECARRAKPADLEKLDQAIKELRAANAVTDPRGSLRAASKFYQLMFAISGKTVAWAMVEGLNLRINSLRTMTITTPGRQKVAFREMELMYKTIANRDAKGAQAAAIEHVEAAAAVARGLLAEWTENESVAPAETAGRRRRGNAAN